MIFIVTREETYSLNPLWVCEGDSGERIEARDGVVGRLGSQQDKKYVFFIRSP